MIGIGFGVPTAILPLVVLGLMLYRFRERWYPMHAQAKPSENLKPSQILKKPLKAAIENVVPLFKTALGFSSCTPYSNYFDHP